MGIITSTQRFFLVCCNGVGPTQDVQTVLLKYINKKNFNLNSCTATGNTAVHVATAYNQVEVLNFFIDYINSHQNDPKNFSLDSRNNSGKTPLYFAANNGFTDIMSILIDNNVTVNTVDINGVSPIYAASNNGHTTVVKILIDNNAFINTRATAENTTPLLASCHNNHIEVAKHLIDSGADTSIANIYGNGPLHVATLRNCTEIARFLIIAECGLNCVNINNQTPLHIAVTNKNLTISRILLQAGADPHVYDSEGYTPLRIAIENCFVEFGKLYTSSNTYSNKPQTTVIIINKQRDDVCMLCLSEISKNDQIAQYLCGHQLHLICYKNLIKTHPSNINSCLSKCVMVTKSPNEM